MHDYKQHSFVATVSCAIILIPALCLAALLVIVWAFTRFMMKGEN